MEIVYEDYTRSMNYSKYKSIYAVQSQNVLTKLYVWEKTEMLRGQLLSRME